LFLEIEMLYCLPLVTCILLPDSESKQMHLYYRLRIQIYPPVRVRIQDKYSNSSDLKVTCNLMTVATTIVKKKLIVSTDKFLEQFLFVLPNASQGYDYCCPECMQLYPLSMVNMRAGVVSFV